MGAFLLEPELRGTLILDGHHLDPELARFLIELRGPARMALVSDATPAAGAAPGEYELGGLHATLHAEGYATSGQGLAGSAVALVECVRTAVQQAGLALETALTLASQTPASWLGLARKGRIAVGCDADLLALDADLRPAGVYRVGAPVPDTFQEEHARSR